MKEEDVKYINGFILQANGDSLALLLSTPERVKSHGLKPNDICYKIAELAKEELDRRNKNSVE